MPTAKKKSIVSLDLHNLLTLFSISRKRIISNDYNECVKRGCYHRQAGVKIAKVADNLMEIDRDYEAGLVESFLAYTMNWSDYLSEACI